MGTSVYFVAASLDGFIADEHDALDWLFQFNDADGVQAHYERFFAGVGAIAMGAKTYQWLLRHEGPTKWPYRGVPTWVFSRRPGLDELGRFDGDGVDVRLARADDGAALAAVDQAMREAAHEKNRWIIGGGVLARDFIAQGLIDELWLTFAPLALGGGAPLFGAAAIGPMDLLSIERFGRGLVELRYRVGGR